MAAAPQSAAERWRRATEELASVRRELQQNKKARRSECGAEKTKARQWVLPAHVRNTVLTIFAIADAAEPAARYLRSYAA